MLRMTRHLLLIVVLVTTILASALLPAQPALARDNCNEVLKAASEGGWDITTIYNINHARYLEWAAKLLAGGSGMVAEVAKVVDELVKITDNDETAQLLGETLIDIVRGKKGKTISYGDADYKLALLTCQHWHNEEVPYCEFEGFKIKCGWRWVRMPEPNTHRLVLGVRDAQ